MAPTVDQTKSEEIDATLSQPNSPKSPISMLPNELLGVIFRECVRIRMDRPVEIALSHVSRHWRGITLAMPDLWISISLSLRAPADMAEAYLIRSASLVIDLFIDICLDESEDDIDDSPLNPSVQDVSPITSHFIPHIHRLRALWVKSDSGQTFINLMKYLKSRPAPVLQTFVVTFRCDRQTGDNDAAGAAFRIFTGGTPNLHSIFFDGISSYTSWCLPPLQNVRNLHMSGFYNTDIAMTHYEAAFLCDNLPSLERLYIHCAHIKEEWPHLELPSLVNLHVYAGSGFSFNNLGNLFKVLHAPNLKDMVLECLNEVSFDRMITSLDGRGDLPQLPNLQTLTIAVAPVSQIPASLFAELGRHCHNVSQLHLTNAFRNSENTWDTFLLSLTSMSTLACTWPALRTLSLDHIGVDSSLLIKMIESRAAAGKPLETLQMTTPGMQLADVDFERIRTYVDVRVFDSWEILSGHTRNWGTEI